MNNAQTLDTVPVPSDDCRSSHLRRVRWKPSGDIRCTEQKKEVDVLCSRKSLRTLLPDCVTKRCTFYDAYAMREEVFTLQSTAVIDR